MPISFRWGYRDVQIKKLHYVNNITTFITIAKINMQRLVDAASMLIQMSDGVTIILSKTYQIILHYISNYLPELL